MHLSNLFYILRGHFDENKLGVPHYPRVGYKPSKSEGGGWCNPEILKIIILRNNLLSMVLNLTVYVRNETSFSSFVSDKFPVKSRYLELSWRRIQFWSIFHWKSTTWAKSAIMTSLWRHTWDVCTFFGKCGKRRPIAIPWYQVTIPQAFIFQVHEGHATAPLPLIDVLE